MILIIAEKPSLGRNICDAIGGMKKQNGYYEGEGYIVTWALGHLFQLYDVEDYTGFTEYDNLLAAANIDDDEIDLYVYDGVVLYEEGAQSAALTFSENLLIPTADEDGRMAIEQLNTAAGKMMT